MDELETAISLLQKAKEERELMIQYNKKDNKLSNLNGVERCKAYIEFHRQFPRKPTKGVINDQIKIARKLLLDAYL